MGDKYRIVSFLGSGGMGNVYRAHQLFLGKDFALKLLNIHKASDSTLRRFQQEARTTAQLQHPNLVEVHDFGVHADGQPYIAMDLVEGKTLTEVLKARGTLSVEHSVSLCQQIAFGLRYAHERGVVHRDIKRGNIILLRPESEGNTTEGSIKIVDFGIAKLMQSENGEIQQMTRTGEIFGSPPYMSPEQCKGGAVDGRSDIYSLGAVMFECLTGLPPFVADNAMSTMMMRLSEEPPSLKEATLGKEFPHAIEQIVRNALRRETTDRYQTCAQLIEDLNRYQQKGEVSNIATHALQQNAAAKRIVGLTERELVLILVTALVAGFIGFAVPHADKALPTSRAEHEDSIKQIKEQGADDDQEFQKITGDQPTVRSDGNTQIIHFPSLAGEIKINGKPKQALGDVVIPNGAKFVLDVDDNKMDDPLLLTGLTDVKFYWLGFSGKSRKANDTSISCLGQMKNVYRLNLSGTNVTSLNPIGKWKALRALNISCSRIPLSELYKVERLDKLDSLTISAASGDVPLFQRLANANSLKELSIVMPSAKGPDLNAADVEALSKIRSLEKLRFKNCRGFDDSQLKKLLALPNLRALRTNNCALTEKSVPVLRQFNKLQTFSTSPLGWTNKALQALHTLPPSPSLIIWQEKALDSGESVDSMVDSLVKL